MSVVQYRVTATLPDEPSARRYLAWLVNGHVQEVVRAGKAAARVVRIRADPPQIASIYTFSSQSDLDRYEHDFAPRLRAEGAALFPPESGIRFTREYSDEILSLQPSAQ